MEKEKEACMHSSIQEKDLDGEALIEKRSAQQEIQEIKQEVVKSVQLKRGKMKKLIEQMRAKARVRKSALESELNALRQKMASEMLKSQKEGSVENCKAGRTNVDERLKYCDKTFIDGYIRNGDCKKEDNFCYMCCENEFGNNHLDRRENCYNMCDIPIAVTATPVKIADGPWLWTPKQS